LKFRSASLFSVPGIPLELEQGVFDLVLAITAIMAILAILILNRRSFRCRWGGLLLHLGCGFRCCLIDKVFEFLAGFEIGDFFGRNLDPRAGLGIASHPRTPLAGTEAAKATDFNLVAGPE
jgi:hypothetical protein